MLAMQYSIALPPDYDAVAIRERVAARRGLFDAHAGLVHKSFLYNDQVKLYAPFYVWQDAQAARNFLLDDLFHGVVETFNRHRVRSWYTVHMGYGNKAVHAQYARREVDIIAPEDKLQKYLLEEKAHQEELLKHPNCYMHLIAFDADRWEIVRFSLWKDKPSAATPAGDAFQEYAVLHVSEPDSFS
jgi:hypothetical protein